MRIGVSFSRQQILANIHVFGPETLLGLIYTWCHKDESMHEASAHNSVAWRKVVVLYDTEFFTSLVSYEQVSS